MTDKLDDDQELWSFLHECLNAGETLVLFEKANGTMREMVCTKRADLIDYEFKNKDDSPDVEKPDPLTLNTVTVWDLENNGWRKLVKGKIETVKKNGDVSE